MRMTHVALFNPFFCCIDREDFGRWHFFTPNDYPDGGDPHDHAEWGMWSEVKYGGYLEEIFSLTEKRSLGIVERKTGDRFRIEADTIHRMVGLTSDFCVTHVAPDHHTGAPHAWAYQFREDGVWRRPIFGGDWHKLD